MTHRASFSVGVSVLLASLTCRSQHKWRTKHVLVNMIHLILQTRQMLNVVSKMMRLSHYLGINRLEISVSTGSWTKPSQCLGVVVEVVWFHGLGVD